MPPIPPDDRPLLNLMQQNRFAFLFVALVLFFLVGPIVELSGTRQGVARSVFTAAFTTMTVAAVFAISRSKRSLLIALLLAVPTFFADAARAWLGTPVSFLVDHTISILFLGYVILVILRMLFTRQRVTTDLIFASLCVYILLGTLWAMAYSTLTLLDAGSFSYSQLSGVPPEGMRFGTETTAAAFYFSLVTMTTLGYGDIIPVSPAAKALAALQAVLGQLYLAVLVARLVGLHVAESDWHARDENRDV